jgi:hypothetical protein
MLTNFGIRHAQARVASCSDRLETIFVVQSAENWLRDDAMAIRNVMATGERGQTIVRRIRDPRSRAGMRPTAIVVRDPLAEQTPHVSLIQRNHETGPNHAAHGTTRRLAAVDPLSIGVQDDRFAAGVVNSLRILTGSTFCGLHVY